MKMRDVMKLAACMIVLYLLVGLTGCGGDGTNSPATVSGVAAAGSPLTGTAFLRDSSNPPRELTISLAEDGSFSFDTRGLHAPFFLKAVGIGETAPVTLYSYSPAPGIANINPLTSLAVADACGNTDLAALYATQGAGSVHLTAAELHDAVARVLAVLRPTLAKLGIVSADFLFDSFAANQEGLDLLLDMLTITVDDGTVTLLDKAAGITTEIPLPNFRYSSIDAVPLATTTPGSVNIWPSAPTISIGKTQDFLALALNPTNQQVTWSIDEAGGGTITSTGRYTAPEAPGTYHVRATSSANGTKSAVATVTVTDVNLIRLVSSGEGVYVLTGENLENVEGVRAEILYDGSILRNPVVAKGSLGPGSMSVSNTNVSGKVVLAYINTTPFSGTTTFATIKFDVLAPEPQKGILSLRVEIEMNSGGYQEVVSAPTYASAASPH